MESLKEKKVRISLTKKQFHNIIDALCKWIDFAKEKNYRDNLEIGEPLYKNLTQKMVSIQGESLSLTIPLSDVLILHGAVADYAIYEGGNMKDLQAIGIILEAKIESNHLGHYLSRNVVKWEHDRNDFRKQCPNKTSNDKLKDYELQALKLLCETKETTELGIISYLDWDKKKTHKRVQELVRKKMLYYTGGGYVDITPKGKMYGKTFYERYMEGEIALNAIDEYVDEWHKGYSESPLHEFLGLTQEQYAHWVTTNTIA